MKHLMFLINPNSGVDRKKAITNVIDQTLDKGQFSYEIQYTQYEKHGIELARKAADTGVYAIIVVGGDGSLNDVIKGLKDTDVILGIIPKGSGNGMARTLGIPMSVKEAIRIINNGKIESVDVAYANEHAFLSNAGVGFDALVIKKFRKSKRRGLLSYCSFITKYIWKYIDQEWNITIDGVAYKETAFLINVANGRQLGYDFVIAPEAEWTDGLLDVTIIKKFPKIMGLVMAIRMKNNTIHKSSYTQTFRAKEVTITAPHLNLLQTDGDSHSTESSILFKIEGTQKIFVP